MRKTEFQRLKEIEDEREMDDLELGDFFLYGTSVVNQKQSKDIGQPISYYQVVEKKEGSVLYSPMFDTLEEDLKEEKREF